MAPLCKFYQQGNCRNGANCRFEHPGANASSNPFGANRFNALNTTARPQDGLNTYKVTRESIKVDLADERPPWILSCYGPGKDAPEQLFGGYPREQSPEEVMLYIRGSANPQQAINEVTALHNQAEQQIRTTLGNLDSAVQFVLAGANNHPNRIDICKQNTIEGGTPGIFAVKTGFADNPLTSNTSANQNPFSTTTQSNPFSGGSGTTAFGQPSALGQKPNPFGAAPSSQFGQPSQMGAAAPAFGQPSQMGASAPAFGQPSQMGASAPAFGQPSNLGQRPNPFSAPSTTAPSPFAQAAQSTFGQPSTLGQAVNPFGAPAAPTAPAVPPANPFGQPGPAQMSASPFAQAAQAVAPTASPFGQPAAPNPFAQAPPSKELAMDTSAPAPAQSNPFGQPPSTNTGFGTQVNPPFGNPSGGFAKPSGGPNAATKPGPYAPGSTKQHPPVESYISKSMNGQIAAFNGQPVVWKWKVNDRYQDQPPENPMPDQQTPGIRKPDGTWRKILFPDGPPAYNKDTEPDPTQYTAAVKTAYAQMAAAGRFQGDMPEVSPMREDCVWTF